MTSYDVKLHVRIPGSAILDLKQFFRKVSTAQNVIRKHQIKIQELLRSRNPKFQFNFKMCEVTNHVSFTTQRN